MLGVWVFRGKSDSIVADLTKRTSGSKIKHETSRLENRLGARIVALGVPAYNANTGKECHLDAHLVEHAIEHLPLDDIDILFIENVGNMICPTDFRLGAEKRIVIISSTEGDDVVNKHPMMFRGSTIGVINKVDLAPFVGANLDRMEQDMRRYNPEMQIFRTNMKTGEGIEELLDAILA